MFLSACVVIGILLCLAAATITSMPTCSVQTVNVSFQGSPTLTGVGSNPSNSVTRNKSRSYAYGTGASQADQVATGVVTIAGAGTSNFNMAALAISNILGTASGTLTQVRELIIEVLNATDTDQDGTIGSASVSTVTIGGHATNPWDSGPLGATDLITIPVGGMVHFSNPGVGWTITAGDILKILNNDAAIAQRLQITIVGKA